jgi:tetratricopeptide (TPR) repeat protein
MKNLGFDYNRFNHPHRVGCFEGTCPSEHSTLHSNGLGVAQDYGKARESLQRAANGGTADAMNSLGLLYCNGQGVAQDYAKAREWFQKAADAGIADAMNSLGLLYCNGQGVAQDYAKAREWFQKAADASIADAMNSLGLLYCNALGVEVLQLCSHPVIGWPDAHPGLFGLRSIQVAAI